MFFNDSEWRRVQSSAYAGEARQLEQAHTLTFERKRQAALALDAALDSGDTARRDAARAAFEEQAQAARAIHQQARALVGKALPGAETNDTDYVFLSFVLQWLPQGLVGLLLAVILCAAMSSSSSELAALGSTTVVDFYRRSFRKQASDQHYLAAARLFTVLWGLVALAFATFASLIDNLIQAVNIVGSLFYGTILGVFLVGFFTKRIRGTPVFLAALVAEAAVIACFVLTNIGFLWWNVIGPGLVVLFSFLFSALGGRFGLGGGHRRA